MVAVHKQPSSAVLDDDVQSLSTPDLRKRRGQTVSDVEGHPSRRRSKGSPPAPVEAFISLAFDAQG